MARVHDAREQARMRRERRPTRGGERALASTLLDGIRAVATRLGNPPAVCRASYIHPTVLDAWRDGSLQRSFAQVAPRTEAQRERWALRCLARRAAD